MKLTATMFAITLFASAAPATTGAETPEAAAESTALAWLSLVDAGNCVSELERRLHVISPESV